MSMDSQKTRLMAVSFFLYALAYGENVSLMEEHIKQSAQNLIKSEQDKKKENPSHPHLYYLSSIVYCDASHWTIWLNDEQIVPLQKEHLLIDILVNSDSVSIKQKDSTKADVILHPHQTINLKNGRIYSGDHRDKIEKEEQKITEGEDFDF